MWTSNRIRNVGLPVECPAFSFTGPDFNFVELPNLNLPNLALSGWHLCAGRTAPSLPFCNP